MTEAEMELGRIDYLVVEYSSAGPSGEALPHLIDMVDRGIIRILDVALIIKADDGSHQSVDLSEVVPMGLVELGLLDGAATGMLDNDDIAEAAAVLEPGRVGAVLVYENSWAAPFATALRRAGGQVVAGGRIPVQEILEALEENE